MNLVRTLVKGSRVQQNHYRSSSRGSTRFHDSLATNYPVILLQCRTDHMCIKCLLLFCQKKNNEETEIKKRKELNLVISHAPSADNSNLSADGDDSFLSVEMDSAMPSPFSEVSSDTTLVIKKRIRGGFSNHSLWETDRVISISSSFIQLLIYFSFLAIESLSDMTFFHSIPSLLSP